MKLIFFIFFINCFYSSKIDIKNIVNKFGKKSNETQEIKTEKDVENLTYKDIGKVSRLPNGALTGERLEQAIKEQEVIDNGGDNKKPTVVVFIPDHLRDKRLGRTRVRSEKLNVIFPDDKLYKNFTSPDVYNKTTIENDRLNFDLDTIVNAEKNNENPFMRILEVEDKLNKFGVVEFPTNHKKNLLELAVEREQEILNRMVENEFDEVKGKRFNRGYSQLKKSVLN